MWTKMKPGHCILPQWLPDLHQHMPNSQPVEDENPHAARRRCRKSLNNNPHIATAYLDQRLQVFMKHILTPLLGVCGFWYRYEWQERGSGHIHGFLWLKDAPYVNEIDWNLLRNPESIISVQRQSETENGQFYHVRGSHHHSVKPVSKISRRRKHAASW